ncbi:MAG: hypothetical protein AB7L84_10990 [Acidimicrobiia bacterium]
MCASCVAQGIAYVGASAGALRVMAARAAHARDRGAVRLRAATGRRAPVDDATRTGTEPGAAVAPCRVGTGGGPVATSS